MKQKHIRYKLKIPEGYTAIIKKATDESGGVSEYWYEDSSLFYVSDIQSTFNDNNIKQSGLFYCKSEFGKHSNIRDTLQLSGKIGNTYWKEMIIGNVQFGYKNIPERSKVDFDRIIDTIKKK